MLSLAKEKEKKKRKERKKIRQNAAGRAEREGGSVSDNTGCESCASGSAVSDVQHATFEPFYLFTAGNCWLQQGKNGRCQVLYMPGMSREECCRSGRLGTSWTEEDVPNSTLFRWMIFNGGAPNCIPCKGGGALIFPLFSHNAQSFRAMRPSDEPSVKFTTGTRQSGLF